MKNMKKILALLVAVLMIAASVSAFAEDSTYTITITKHTSDKAAHTYGAFQVFKGKLEEVDGKKVLSDIQWGDNVTSATAIAELKKIDSLKTLADDASAKVVAKAISDLNLAKDAAVAQQIADAFAEAVTTTPLKTGTIAADATSGAITGLPAGYYFVKDTTDVEGEGAETRFILEVVGNVAVTEKASVPTVEKKVQEKDDSTGTTAWQDAADYDIGDPVPYKITGTLPSTFEEFDTYKTYTFTDTLSDGLTPPASSAVSVKDNNGVDLVDKGLFTVNVNGQVITVSLASGKDLRASTDPAFTHESTIIVTYEAVLNQNAKLGSVGNDNKVKIEFSNNPNYDSDGDTGTTPEDKVTVFTFKLITNKLDEDGTTPLKGAGFTLYKWDASQTGTDKYVQVGEEMKGVDMTTFQFTGKDSGQYKLVETTVPTGYNKADDLEFKVVATYGTEGNPPTLTDLKVTDLAGNKLTTWTISSVTYDEVASQYAQGSVDIENHKGSQLPSTGGMGTTILYVGGSILVLAAVILLVTKRRMNADE